MPDKIIVITGANGGLGRALARRFVADGEQVVLLGRSLSKVTTMAEALGERAVPIECDLTVPASIHAAFTKIGKLHPQIDALISCAATFKPFLLEEATEEQIMSAVLTNLAGPIFCARWSVPLLRRGGHIINVSSESVDMPFPHLTLYQSTKSGLETFSRHLDSELEARGIRVTTVRAGQMTGHKPDFDFESPAVVHFMEAAKQRGLDLMARGSSTYESTTEIFRSLIDLPADLKVGLLTYQARIPTDS